MMKGLQCILMTNREQVDVTLTTSHCDDLFES